MQESVQSFKSSSALSTPVSPESMIASLNSMHSFLLRSFATRVILLLTAWRRTYNSPENTELVAKHMTVQVAMAIECLTVLIHLSSDS